MLYHKWEINPHENQEVKFNFPIQMSQFDISILGAMMELCKHGSVPYLMLIYETLVTREYISPIVYTFKTVKMVICPQLSSLFQALQIFYQPDNGVIQINCVSFLNYFMINLPVVHSL